MGGGTWERWLGIHELISDEDEWERNRYEIEMSDIISLDEGNALMNMYNIG